MKLRNKEIMSIVAATLLAQTAMFSNSYASEIKLNEDKIVGINRYETAIEVSKKGWPKGATNAVLVNDTSIVDALSATPFAKAKDAPILLTKKDTLNEETKQQLKTLGVKNVYIIGGEGVVSKEIEEQLKAENINTDRIQGLNREATSIEIAKRLDKINPVKEVSLVNGYKGLADAVSIASISANKNMPIILSGMDKISTEATEFIGSNNINKSYIVGGDSVVSSDLESKLPNATRISGKNRKETNANVISTFFTEKEIDNLYIAKDGMQNENQLIDALSVGSLAAKTNSPVMIAGNDLDKSQKDLVNSKVFKTITKVGGNGNESAFDEIKDIQNGVITSKPEVQEPDVPGQVEPKPEQEPNVQEQVPSNPEQNQDAQGQVEPNPEQNQDAQGPNAPEQVPSKPEQKPNVPVETPSKPNEDSNTEKNEPVTPEQITLYSSREGKNADGLGDTTYEELKSSGKWTVEKEGTLSAYNGRLKFENLNGRNDLDAKLTIKYSDSEVDKEVLKVLTLMNGKEESQFTAEQIGRKIGHGSATMKDGSRYIDIEYDGKMFYTITVTFSNFGITPLHEAIEGTNERGFGDTTYEELRNSAWIVDPSNKNKVRSNKGNVSFENKNGVDDVDAIIEMEGNFDKNNEDLLYSLSLMLNSCLEAEKLANRIQEDYDSDYITMIIAGKYSAIRVDVDKDKQSVKITFKNIYKDDIEPSL